MQEAIQTRNTALCQKVQKVSLHSDSTNRRHSMWKVYLSVIWYRCNLVTSIIYIRTFHSLRSKRFRLVSDQRKTEEGDSRFWPREKWNKSQKMKVGGGGGEGRTFLSSPPPPRSFTCARRRSDADPLSRVSGAPRALRARLSSPDKRNKLTPVMQANFLKWPSKMQIITFRVREVIASKNRIAIVSPESWFARRRSPGLRFARWHSTLYNMVNLLLRDVILVNLGFNMYSHCLSMLNPFSQA